MRRQSRSRSKSKATTSGKPTRRSASAISATAALGAENPEWEIGESRISKLWIQRQADKREVFNWDRGPDRMAVDDTTLQIVSFLADGLADFIYAE